MAGYPAGSSHQKISALSGYKGMDTASSNPQADYGVQTMFD